MKKYVEKEDAHTNTESIYDENEDELITKYFHFYCDICGVKHPDVCVNDLCEEEGYPNGDYCWNCQKSMNEQGFVGKDKSKYLYKESNCKKSQTFSRIT